MAVLTFLAAAVTAILFLISQRMPNQTDLFATEVEDINERPLVGILAQEADFQCERENYTTYIPASYVKYVESIGARAVALKFTDPLDTLKEKMDHINGLILPGGDTLLIKAEDGDDYSSMYNQKEYTRYMDVTQFLLNIAMEKNDNGIHFPVFGICLGFQSLMIAARDKKAIDHCDSRGFASTQVIQNKSQSQWFKNLSQSTVDILATQKLVLESHYDCFTKETWEASEALQDFYLLTSTNQDRQGLEYVNSIEGKQYPFFGVQYHPERPAYEFISPNPLPHSANALKWSHFLVEQFGHHLRRNPQRYPTIEEENSALIYNSDPLYGGNDVFIQSYCYDKKKQGG